VAASRKIAKKLKSPKRRLAPETSRRSSDVDDAEERLRAKLREEQARAAEREEEEDELDEEDDEHPLAVYDPAVFGIYALATHSAVPNEHLSALNQGGRQLRELVQTTTAALAKQQEGLFTGYSVNSQLASDQLKSAYSYGDAQRTRADDLQQALAKKDLEIANMVRQSEEAKLEYERLQAEKRRGEQSLERLEMELNAKLQARQAELVAVQRAAAPVFGAVAQGITMAVQHYGLKAVAGGLPSAPSQQSGAAVNTAGAPEAQVSTEGAAEWLATVVADLQTLRTPRVAACLRAMLCSYALGDFDAPPLPKVVNKQLLFDLLVEEIGQAKVVALLESCRAAYVTEPPAATQATGASAPN
jgi:hypothetical protein